MAQKLTTALGEAALILLSAVALLNQMGLDVRDANFSSDTGEAN